MKKAEPLTSMLDLTAKTCRWPFGHPGDKGFGFCGQQIKANSPYCAEHFAVAYKPRPKRKTADVFE